MRIGDAGINDEAVTLVELAQDRFVRADGEAQLLDATS
jgi:hypothetical protein